MEIECRVTNHTESVRFASLSEADVGWVAHKHDFGQVKEPRNPLWFGSGIRQPVEIHARNTFEDLQMIGFRVPKLLPPPPPPPPR